MGKKNVAANALTYAFSKVKAWALGAFAAASHSHAATDITSGTLDAARVPSLDASKIATGTLPVARGGTGQTTLAAARNAAGLGNTTGALPIANGGTGQTTVAAARNAFGLGNTAGAVPIANGGTGLTASPSMLTNLGSTTAANVLQASPRPGVTGTLPIANGGTGQTTATAARNALGAVDAKGAFLAAHPVGSYYECATSPATTYGGTWVAYCPMGMPRMWRRTA